MNRPRSPTRPFPDLLDPQFRRAIRQLRPPSDKTGLPGRRRLGWDQGDLAQQLLFHARVGNLEALRRTLRGGADPNAQGPQGESALTQAARYGQEGALAILLEYGADPNRKSFFDIVPLHLAAARSARMVRALLEAGANPLICNSRGESALHYAARANSAESARILLQAGCPPDARKNEGPTPLHYAVFHHNLPVAALLLQAGADPNLRDRCSRPQYLAYCRAHRSRTAHLLELAGFSPLDLACLQRFARMGRMLLWAGASPDPLFEGASGPLHLAARMGSIPLIWALLQAGADPTLKDELGRTALECARDSRRPLAAWLISRYCP